MLSGQFIAIVMEFHPRGWERNDPGYLYGGALEFYTLKKKKGKSSPFRGIWLLNSAVRQPVFTESLFNGLGRKMGRNYHVTGRKKARSFILT